MAELWFYEEGDPEMFLDPAPGLPRFVVIDLSDAYRRFEKESNRGEHLGFDVEVQLAEILQEISIRKDAEHNVCVTNHTYVSDNADTELSVDVQEFVNARQEFCDFLIRHIDQLRLYTNGYLFYTFGRLLGDRLILEKIGVALEEKDRNARRIAQQADFALKRLRRQYR